MTSLDDAAARRARRERVVLEHMDSENAQDWERTLATFSRPRYELVPPGIVHEGRDDVLQYYVTGRSVFPDQRNELIALHHGDDSVIVEFWLRGTHVGGEKPTGRAFTCRMCAVFTFDDDDLMVNERVYFDQTTITNQLRGVTPSD